MQSRRLGWAACGRTVALALSLVWLGSCNDLVTDSRSATQLVIELLEARPGNSTTFSGQLSSDVEVIVGGNATVINDFGRIGARLAFKDPGTIDNPTSPTSANWITVTRYRVEYERADGRNTPGVDVPYPFDGGLTFSIVDTIVFDFTLVRLQAKLEPPLLGLAGFGGGAVSIATVAKVTFFGNDQSGAAVRATGRINVTFADFADPSS